MIAEASLDAIRQAQRRGLKVRMKQLSTHWIVVIDGELAHIDDAPMLVRDALARREREKVAA